MIWFDIDGQIFPLKIPPTVENITFNDWCEFRNLEAKYNAFEGKQAEADLLLLQALGKIIGGRLDKLPVYIPGDDIKEMLENGFMLELDGGISLTRLHAHIITLVNSYIPDNIPTTFKYKWAGFRFHIKQEPVARVLMNKPLLTGEALECMEYDRRARKRKETQPLDVGNIDFNLGLRELAILVKRKNEQLPYDKKKRNEFINKRMKLFKDIPLSIVLNMRFFFIKSLINYNKKKQTNHFGKAVLVRTGQKKQRPKKKRYIWQRQPGK